MMQLCFIIMFHHVRSPSLHPNVVITSACWDFRIFLTHGVHIVCHVRILFKEV